MCCFHCHLDVFGIILFSDFLCSECSAHRAAVLSAFPFLNSPIDGKSSSEIGKNEQIEHENDEITHDDDGHDEKQQVNDNANDAGNSLMEAVIEESCLSHYAPLSRNCSIAVNYLCRALIIGKDWKESLQLCHQFIEDEVIQNILKIFISDTGQINVNNFRKDLSKGGYAPEVFKAALYFLDSFSSFDASMNAG